MSTGGAARWSAADAVRDGGTRAQEHSNHDPASHLVFRGPASRWAAATYREGGLAGRAGYQAQWKPATVFSINLR
jgi:hypothetical protein